MYEMRFVLILVLIMTGLVLAGCQGRVPGATSDNEPAVTIEKVTPEDIPAGAPTTNAKPTVAAAPADPASILGNLTYTGVLPDQPVTLSAGVAAYEEEGSGQPYVELMDTLISTGDLDGDGMEDAAAFLVDNTTGSADFVYLVVVLNVRAEPAPVEAILIGDRTPVKSMTIADSQVIVETFAPGAEDAACCPSQQVRLVFVLENGRLVETGRKELGGISLADLNGTSWQLVDLNLDQEPIPAGIDITLNVTEGQISGSAGCNNYTASVTAGEDGVPQSLAVGPIAATQMLCDDPVATLETSYLARLGNVVAWRYAFGHLSLTYELEEAVFGELLFAPQEP